MQDEKIKKSEEEQKSKEESNGSKTERDEVNKLYEELEKEEEETIRMLKNKEAELEELGALWKGEAAENFKREMIKEYESLAESVKSDLKAVYIKVDDSIESAKENANRKSGKKERCK